MVTAVSLLDNTGFHFWISKPQPGVGEIKSKELITILLFGLIIHLTQDGHILHLHWAEWNSKDNLIQLNVLGKWLIHFPESRGPEMG